ncbi:hypothetical protein NLX86_30190 [Streptomyces sp. A3M-1-3]|uniref:hypothetical protein n=1 Tax=Streptomyces sp. A3M-1-3 TaxID=2962044 RepID=UPI0020B6A2CA|nr:hypothetical protein [Streptomyces sp. A3M-1-3]MCP3822206.1 hypothetical protein [Streptomyces sp. A3M-1-3]
MQLVRRPRAVTLAVAALAVALLVTGCAQDTEGAGTAGDSAPAGSGSGQVTTDPSDLARMQKLLEGAESAANDADAAADE